MKCTAAPAYWVGVAVYIKNNYFYIPVLRTRLYNIYICVFFYQKNLRMSKKSSTFVS